ncbi:DUF4231 domain-containing protein [Kocuria sp. M4R2S49]|uniref:DUF4231 domain-containing protein n=1 Tax=Kocuria rhizosphaericola TaxID=3376284 RepID=UPI00378C16B6
MDTQLSGIDLPGLWYDADAASLRGQKLALRYARGRILGGIVAALGGAVSWSAGQFDVAVLLIFLGFLVALASELASWVQQPEHSWYGGRAVAESTKTLAWRYAVGGQPFPVTMPDDMARELLRSGLEEVLRETSEYMIPRSEHAVVTPAMEQLRQQPFDVRREAYVRGRTEDQRRWYTAKAEENRRRSQAWRLLLVLAEVTALVLAFLRVFVGWPWDFAGVLGATVAGGAAWVAVKQFAPLASAYSTAAKELLFQVDRLGRVPQEQWAAAVANVEGAISREHTLWTASRTGRTFFEWGNKGIDGE